MTLKLYPVRPIPGEDFTKTKMVTLPNQNLTLREIIKRFTRHEQLPVAHQGVYIENMGDLEKLAKADLTVQTERAAQLKSYIKNAEKRMKQLKDADEAKNQPPSPGSGGVVPDGAGVSSRTPETPGEGAKATDSRSAKA